LKEVEALGGRAVFVEVKGVASQCRHYHRLNGLVAFDERMDCEERALMMVLSVEMDGEVVEGGG